MRKSKILLASLLFKYLISDFKSDEIQRDYQKSLGKVNFYELLVGGSKHIQNPSQVLNPLNKNKISKSETLRQGNYKVP